MSDNYTDLNRTGQTSQIAHQQSVEMSNMKNQMTAAKINNNSDDDSQEDDFRMFVNVENSHRASMAQKSDDMNRVDSFGMRSP